MHIHTQPVRPHTDRADPPCEISLLSFCCLSWAFLGPGNGHGYPSEPHFDISFNVVGAVISPPGSEWFCSRSFQGNLVLLLTQMETEQRPCDATLCHMTHGCLEAEVANVSFGEWYILILPELGDQFGVWVPHECFHSLNSWEFFQDQLGPDSSELNSVDVQEDVAILIIIHSDEDFRIYHQPTEKHFIAFLLKCPRTNIPAELMQQLAATRFCWNILESECGASSL